MEKWSRIKYQPNRPLRENEYVTCSKEHIALSKEAATEGIVLLKNDGLLPLQQDTKVALFGKGSFDYVKGGGGSGDVYTKYIKNVYDGIKEYNLLEVYEPLCDFYRENVQEQYKHGAAPGMTVEPAVPAELLEGAANNADVALVFISRFSGEGWDRSSVEYEGEYNPWESETSMPKLSGQIFPDGDFYLSNNEKEMINSVKAHFNKVIVLLNIGGVIDTSWIKKDANINACLHIGQGGMEGGSAAAFVLCGIKTPSGKLTDTYAATLEAYPSTANFHDSPDYVEYTEDIFVGYRYFETFGKEVVYPFGYGLSYTSFDIKCDKAYLDNVDMKGTSPDNATSNCTCSASANAIKLVSANPVKDIINLTVTVTNTGDYSGKEVVQVYAAAPMGKLGKAAKVLCGFRKTRELKPGESESVEIAFPLSQLASYDDLGKVAKSAYVLEAGDYEIFVGNSLQNVTGVTVITVSEDTITEQLTSKCAPSQLAKRLTADGSYEALPLTEPNDMNACAFPKMVPGTEEAWAPAEKGRPACFLLHPFKNDAKPLSAVADGQLTVDEFIAQLETEDLIELLGGQPNRGVGNTWGMGNKPEYDIPNLMTADGPAGIRLNENCGIPTTAWPCATVLACTWNTDLAEKVGAAAGAELKENNLAIWLAPAVNIHRNPLCGRNFEYYSEDPYIAGKIGAALVRGIQSNQIGCSVKHFAANNKETNRKHSDSRVSERALREIYLKQFEIIVKESKPWTIMSAYNAINGHRASENKELLTGILREEWGFKGLVTSDWWTRGEHYKEILAGNDMKMANGYPERVQKALDLGVIERKDLEICVKRLLELMLKYE